jgi:NTP pyrophosphatase (non-canonical NTP hydrolase)
MLENFTTNLQSRTSILAEFTGLRDQIGQWADQNFDVHLPELGVAEEIGELTHAILKREQKIRGEAKRRTNAEIKDALGDAAIYMLHLAYKQHITPNFANELVPIDKEFPLLGAMHRSAGVLILKLHHFNGSFPLIVEWAIIFTNLWNFAALHKLNLLTLTKDVWTEVFKRDWRKYPKNGLTT